MHALESLSAVGGDLVDNTVKANFRALGKRFGKGTPPVAARRSPPPTPPRSPPRCARTARPR